MDPEQPYHPPSADLAGPPSAVADGGSGLTHGIIDALSSTRPWVLFVGIMTMLGCGLMVLIGLGVMIAGGLPGTGDELGAGGGVVIGGVYLLMALLYLVPGLHLLRFAAAVKQIGPDTPQTVEKALRHQLSFWRFVGISAIVVLGIYALAIVFMIIAGVMAAAS